MTSIRELTDFDYADEMLGILLLTLEVMKDKARPLHL